MTPIETQYTTANGVDFTRTTYSLEGAACTERACFTLNEPKCLEYAECSIPAEDDPNQQLTQQIVIVVGMFCILGLTYMMNYLNF